MQELRRICDKHGILLVLDEVQSGIGRTGKWFAVEHTGVHPDMVCIAKGIASGMPLGITMSKADIMDWVPGSHASTFGGNPVCIAAALATLDVIEKEGLLKNSQEVGAHMLKRMADWPKKHKIVGDVRGRGLMIGVEIVKDQKTREYGASERDRIVELAFERGVLFLGGGAMRTVLGPQPRNKTPRSNAHSPMRSRSPAPYPRVLWSFTISTPLITPHPRTSPTILCFLGQPAMRLSMWSPTSCEFLSSPSFSITSSVASAAAIQTGFPPKVDACEPGTQSMISALLMVMPSGIPDAMPFAMQTMSGCTPVCSTANHLPVRPMPLWISSSTTRMPRLSHIRPTSCTHIHPALTYPPSPS